MREQVGRYIIKGQLGKGAMGVVYLAEDPVLGRQAAIKTVDLSVEDPAEREFLRTRLLRDARAAAGLTHPNIVSVYDVVEDTDAAYLVLEFVPGDTLAARLTGAAPILDPAFSIHVLRGMAAALDYTHARGIVHRDVKPANVMIDPTGTPKIMDFGIARIADSRTNTPTGMVMGTIDYMSPEQIKGEPLDGRSDQFALAAVAVRLLTGQTLYGQHSLPTLAYKIVHEPVPPMRARNSWLPPAVDTVLGRALGKTPGERYPTCSQFVQDLATALAMDTVEPPTRTAPIPVMTPGAPPPPPTVGFTPQAAPPSTQVPTYAPPAPPPSAQVPGYAPPPTAQPFAPTPVYPPAAKKGSKAALIGIAGVLAAGAAVALWQPWNSGKQANAPDPTAPPQVASAPTAATAPPPSTPPTEKAPASKAAEPPTPSKPAPAKTETAVSATPKQSNTAPPPGKQAAASDADFTPPPDIPAAEDEAPPKDTPAPAQEAYQTGRKMLQQRQFAAAVEAFNKALSIRQHFPMALFYRGRAYQQLNDCQAAIKDFDALLQARPKYVQGYTYRGLCESRLKNDDAGLADFEQALAINPRAGMALFGRGMVRNHRGNYRKAIEDLDLAAQLVPKYPNIYEVRAKARRALGNEAGAKADEKMAQDLTNAGRGTRRGGLAPN